MGIKKAHTHDNGKECYETYSRHQLTHKSIISIPNGSFAVAYMPYTGTWYAYNINTGREIASFDREFYEGFISQFVSGDLIEDPDCLV